MFVPWIIDWSSRLAGVDVYGVAGFYIPYFYALSDQIAANISGALFLRRQDGAWLKAFSHLWAGYGNGPHEPINRRTTG